MKPILFLPAVLILLAMTGCIGGKAAGPNADSMSADKTTLVCKNDPSITHILMVEGACVHQDKRLATYAVFKAAPGSKVKISIKPQARLNKLDHNRYYYALNLRHSQGKDQPYSHVTQSTPIPVDGLLLALSLKKNAEGDILIYLGEKSRDSYNAGTNTFDFSYSGHHQSTPWMRIQIQP